VRRLILSDIHSNHQALRAVEDDARGRYDEIVCLGDFVGYGGSPCEVVEWSRARVNLCVRGNHDKGVVGLDDMEMFNSAARQAAYWSRARLSSEDLLWLRSLPQGPVVDRGVTFVHGSPGNEDEYLTCSADTIGVTEALETTICFFGHSHLQGGFRWRTGRCERLPRPSDEDSEIELALEEGAYYLVNPGSVGQPRDGDPRAAYLIWDDESRTVIYRRVEYDIEGAQKCILDAGLPVLLAQRLSRGR
jgi:diadenosine tetraphosphatase ApaH/serine/threonine PP2A family protein phosphatase